MKFWNKDKRIRKTHWYAVERPNHKEWTYQQIKHHLQLLPSPNKFYLYYAGGYIWFESAEDALMCKLYFG